jgi:hypothetical protein
MSTVARLAILAAILTSSYLGRERKSNPGNSGIHAKATRLGNLVRGGGENASPDQAVAILELQHTLPRRTAKVKACEIIYQLHNTCKLIAVPRFRGVDANDRFGAKGTTEYNGEWGMGNGEQTVVNDSESWLKWKRRPENRPPVFANGDLNPQRII